MFCDQIGDMVTCFFFSSRRRHTMSTRDWSSDVCSSDLLAVDHEHGERPVTGEPLRDRLMATGRLGAAYVGNALVVERPAHLLVVVGDLQVPEHRRTAALRGVRAAPCLLDLSHGHVQRLPCITSG